MDKRTIDEFRIQAKSVSLPEGVRSSVLDAARVGRDSGLGAPSAAGAAARPERRVARRAVAVAACAAVALVVAALSGASGLPWVSGGAGAAGSGGTTDFFELKAYAEGVPQGGEVLLSLDDFSRGSLSGGDDGAWRESHGLDLSCAGENIASISYALEGPHVISTDGSDAYPSIMFQNERNDHGSGTVSYSSTSFSVDYDSQSTGEQGWQRDLVVDFAETDEMRAVEDEIDALESRTGTGGETADDVRQELTLWNQLEYLSQKQYAQVLSETTLVMTVTFDDGTTQTKSYVIAPVDDFDQRYADYSSRLTDLTVAAEESPDDETARDQLQEYLADPPLLYSIAETSDWPA